MHPSIRLLLFPSYLFIHPSIQSPIRSLAKTQERGWDPTLMFVMGGALAVALPLYQALGLARNSNSKAIADWAARPVTGRGSLLGGALFGCGWGVCGMCPGE